MAGALTVPASQWETAAAAGAVGLVAGGYVTVLIERVPAAWTVSGSLRELRRRPLGECPHCAARLRAADIIPLVSWVRTRGACRHCGEPFGAWHPAAELITAALFALMGLRFGPSPVLPAFCYLAAVAVALAFIDTGHRRLPDMLTLPSYPVALLLLGAAALATANGTGDLIHAIAGLACASAFYLVLALIYPAGIGWGDVKLSGLLGLYLGWIGTAALVIGLAAGFVLAGVTGIGLIAAGKATRKSQIPFGPFMLAGALAVIAVGALAG
jgi:leader peptidase (prepilin peptidase) / N-methyltransferase